MKHEINDTKDGFVIVSSGNDHSNDPTDKHTTPYSTRQDGSTNLVGSKRTAIIQKNNLATSIENQKKRLQKLTNKIIENNKVSSKEMNLVIDPNSNNSANSKKDQLFNQSFNSSDKLRFTEFT
jgi:hypothetical protein